MPRRWAPHRVGEEVEHAAILLFERRDKREDALHEAASLRTLRAEARLAVRDAVADGALGGVVRWVQPGSVDEGPHGGLEFQDLGRHASGLGIRAHRCLAKQASNPPPDTPHSELEIL